MSSKARGKRTGAVSHKLVFDPKTTLASVQCDVNLLREVYGLLVESIPGVLSQIRSAIDGGDGQDLERSAHELRGAVKVFGAGYVSKSALALEQMGRFGDLSNAQHCYIRLVDEIEELEQELADFIEAR